MTAPSLPLRDTPAMVLGASGLVAGGLSALLGIDRPFEPLQPLADLFLLRANVLPVGLAFAAALGLGVGVLTRRPLPALAAALMALYAWSGAIHLAIRLQRNVGDTGHLLAAALLAGALGASLTHLGASLGLPHLRNWRALARTILVGAVFGLLFFASERALVPQAALFLLWQPAVAFTIGLAAARRD